MDPLFARTARAAYSVALRLAGRGHAEPHTLPMLERFPGLVFACALAFGIWTGGCAGPHPRAAIFVFLLGAGCVVRGVIRPPLGSHDVGRRRALQALCFAAAGHVRAGHSEPGSAQTPGAPAASVSVRGILDMPPIAIEESGGGAARIVTSFSIIPEDGSSRILAICPDRPAIAGGDLVVAVGSLRTPTGPRNPGDLSSPGPRFLGVPDAAGVRAISTAHWTSLTSILGALRGCLARTTEALYAEDMRGFILAMVLGDRRLLSSEIHDALLLTGTFHLLAISGLHVTLLMFGLFRAPLPARLRGPVRLVALVLFTLLTGASPPVLRAALMFLLQMLAEWRWRKARPLNTLGWSAVILLANDTTLLEDLGFQLSFVSVAAILTWGDRLGGWARRLPPGARLGASSLLVSTGTSAGTTPLILYHFQRIHPLGPIWNLLAYPLTLVPLAGGLLSIGLGTIHPSLGAPAAWAVDRLSRAFLLPLELGARIPWSTLYVPPPPAWAVAASYALLALGLRPSWRRATCLVAGAAVLVCLAGFCLTHRVPEVWTFDAGPGDAALLRAPGAGSVLIDAGARGRADSAGAALSRAILASGSRSLEAAFITHPHADHTRGLEGVASRLGVSRVWIPPGFGGPGTGAALLASARAARIRIDEASRGLHLVFGEVADGARGLEVEVLFPFPGGAGGFPVGVNDVSLALRVSWRGDSVLYLGDLEEDGIAALLCAERDLSAQVLMAPHHGRQNKLWPEILERVRPRSVVISGTGDGGARELAARLELAGIAVFATWRRGAVRTVWRQGYGWAPGFWRED